MHSTPAPTSPPTEQPKPVNPEPAHEHLDVLWQLLRELDSSLFHDAQLFKPALLVHVKTRELDIDNGHNAFKLELCALHQRLRLQSLDQLFTQWQQDRGVTCGVFKLRLRQLEIPVAQTL